MSQTQPPASKLSPQWAAFWTALIYLATVMIAGGGAGIWLPAFMPTREVGVDALATYVMAVLAPIVADLVLDNDFYGEKLSKLWRAAFVGACIIASAFAIVALVRDNAAGAWPAGVFAVVLSLIIWFILVIKCHRFLPSGSNKGSIGGANPTPNVLGGGGLPQ